MGRAIGRFRRASPISAEDFFSCQYVLNLIAQGVHFYFSPSFLDRQLYLDAMGCSSHSFRAGDSARPIDLVAHVRDRGVLVADESLVVFTDYILEKHFQALVSNVGLSDFCSALIEDSDCLEIHQALKGIMHVSR